MLIDSLSRKILDRYQKGLPLSSTPYADMANELNVSEQQVLDCLQGLKHNRVITRVGPVFNHHKAGASTLAALAVPLERLQTIADYINQFEGVNHNYEREHEFNLWFVMTAPDQEQLQANLEKIKQDTEMPMLILPMKRAYHIDLGFKLQWSDHP